MRLCEIEHDPSDFTIQARWVRQHGFCRSGSSLRTMVAKGGLPKMQHAVDLMAQIAVSGQVCARNDKSRFWQEDKT